MPPPPDVPASTSGIRLSFLGLSQSSGPELPTYLLTRSLLPYGASPGSSLNLHVLGTPPAFVTAEIKLSVESDSRVSIPLRVNK